MRVRRRRLQPGHVRRDAQPRRAVAAAGRLHGHQQPVRHGHLARAPLRRRPTCTAAARASACPGMQLRRHGRARHLRGASARRSSRRARTASRCSSRRSPTASAATRWPTPRSTAPRSRSRSGASGTRSRSSRERLEEEGVLEEGEAEQLDEAVVERDRRGRRRSPTARRSRRPSRSTTTSTCSATRCSGWYSVDERSAGVHRGEHERELAEAGARPAARTTTQAVEQARRARTSASRRPPTRRRPRTSRRREEAGGRVPDGGHALPRGAQPGAARGDAARRERLPHGRGHRRLQRRLQGHRRAARGVRREARARHADLREHDRRHGRRRGDDRPAPGRRADDDQLLAARAWTRSSTTWRRSTTCSAARCRVPMVVRMPQGAGHQLGPTHSHCFEALFLHVPGMLVAVPSTAADAKGLLKAAIRDDNPVVFIEHEYLYGQRGDVPDDDDHIVDFGQAAIRREGDDVTIVGISRMALTAEKAAEHARRGARDRGRGDRPAHAAPARPRHDPRVGAQDQPLRDRRGGLAARRRRREPRRADPGAGLRPPRRARRAASPAPTCRCPTPSRSSRSPTRTSRRSSRRCSPPSATCRRDLARSLRATCRKCLFCR